jgi:hypothetical protein
MNEELKATLDELETNYDRWAYLLYDYSFRKDADPEVIKKLWDVESTEDGYSIDGEKVDDLHPVICL